MNTVGKVFFWLFVIILGFVNPLISFALIVLYYLPKIISDACNTCKDACSEDDSEEEFYTYEEKGTRTTVRKKQNPPKMDSFSDDTLEDMR